jgi:hypothetical protein
LAMTPCTPSVGILQEPQRAGAIHLRHHDVEQDGVWLECSSRLDGRGSGSSHADCPSLHHFQTEARHLADGARVVDDQQMSRRRFRCPCSVQ